jgi:hypothetical protein
VCVISTRICVFSLRHMKLPVLGVLNSFGGRYRSSTCLVFILYPLSETTDIPQTQPHITEVSRLAALPTYFRCQCNHLNFYRPRSLYCISNLITVLQYYQSKVWGKVNQILLDCTQCSCFVT